jgi:hypothetical protein
MTGTAAELEESKEAKKDVSFSTLLDDSSLSFNPDQAPQTSVVSTTNATNASDSNKTA